MRLCLPNLGVSGTSLASLFLLLYSNEMLPNAPKHEFWVQWSGSRAFIPKNFNATSFSELVR
jgi:hypothetical protein